MAPATRCPTRRRSSPSEGRSLSWSAANDQIVGHADQYRALRHYPDTTYSQLEHAGHYLRYERPGMLRALTRDWLRRCDA